MNTLRTLPFLELHWDGWWLVENNGSWITGPFGEAEAHDELRWAIALHHGNINPNGREELRKQRRAREYAEHKPGLMRQVPWRAINLAVIIAVWAYVLFFMKV